MTQHRSRSSQSAHDPEHLPAQNHAAAEVEGACPFLPVALHRFPEEERGGLTPQPLLAVARKRVVNEPVEASEQRRTHVHALEASGEDASNASAQKHPHWIRPAIAR